MTTPKYLLAATGEDFLAAMEKGFVEEGEGVVVTDDATGARRTYTVFRDPMAPVEPAPSSAPQTVAVGVPQLLNLALSTRREVFAERYFRGLEAALPSEHAGTVASLAEFTMGTLRELWGQRVLAVAAQRALEDLLGALSGTVASTERIARMADDASRGEVPTTLSADAVLAQYRGRDGDGSE